MTEVKKRFIDFDALAAAATQKSLLTLAASTDGDQREEVTGEYLEQLVTDAGGTSVVERDPETGVITSIEASFVTLAEYDHEEMSEVLESLHATGVVPKKIVGDLAQTSIGINLPFTGTTTSSSASVTAVSTTVGLLAGMPVTGVGVPAGATIISVGSGTITLSANATATGSAVAMVAAAEQQVIGLNEWTIEWKRKTVEATTTDDALYESSLGSTKSWTVKAKYMFVDGDSSQVAGVLSAIDTLSLSALMWNFFPTVELGRSGFSGLAIIDGITIASGMGKVVGLDVGLKGTGPLMRMVQTAPVVNPTTVTGMQGEV